MSQIILNYDYGHAGNKLTAVNNYYPLVACRPLFGYCHHHFFILDLFVLYEVECVVSF
jgi:hypothetical protein